MAKIVTLTPEQQAEFDEWLAGRPPVIREMVRTHPPDRLYRLKSRPDQRVTIYSYSEDRTVTVVVSGQYNLCVFERNVFGIPEADLEECDLPGPDEPLGVALTEPDEVDRFVDAARPIILAARKERDR